MSVRNLEKLIVNHLIDTHDAEQQIDNVRPRRIKSASDEQLIEAFECHLAEGGQQTAALALLTQTLLSRAFRLP